MNAVVDITRTPSQKCNQQVAAPAHAWCSAPSGSRHPWCVVATYPKAERRAHASLHRCGLETYLPLITVRWANRTWHTGPAFPGYLFVRLDLDRPWSPVTFAPGVFQLLSCNGKPATCPDTVVEAVQSALHAAEARDGENTRWKPGQPCSLALGPLRGMPAVITAIHDQKASLAVMMLGELRAVSVGVDCLKARDE